MSSNLIPNQSMKCMMFSTRNRITLSPKIDHHPVIIKNSTFSQIFTQFNKNQYQLQDNKLQQNKHYIYKSASGFQVAALKIKITKQYLIVIFGNFRNFIIFINRGKPQNLLSIFYNHNSWELLTKTRGIYVVAFGNFGQFANIYTNKLKLFGCVFVGVSIPQLFSLSQMYMYKCASQCPVRVELNKVHHFVSIFQVQKFIGLFFTSGSQLADQVSELLLTLNGCKLIGTSKPRIRYYQPAQHTDHHIIYTVLKLSKKQQTSHTNFPYSHRINKEL